MIVEKFINSITKKGQGQVKGSLKKLKNKQVDFIFSSDLLRTKQTAKIVAKTLNSMSEFDKSSTTFKRLKVVLDKRLREISFGSFNRTYNGMSLEKLFSKSLKPKKDFIIKVSYCDK